MRKLISIIFLCFLLSGCGAKQLFCPEPLPDPKLVALEKVVLKIPSKKLDLSYYKNIHWITHTDSNGNYWVMLSLEDFKKLSLLHKEISHYIVIQDTIIDNITEINNSLDL